MFQDEPVNQCGRDHDGERANGQEGARTLGARPAEAKTRRMKPARCRIEPRRGDEDQGQADPRALKHSPHDVRPIEVFLERAAVGRRDQIEQGVVVPARVLVGEEAMAAPPVQRLQPGRRNDDQRQPAQGRPRVVHDQPGDRRRTGLECR